MMFNVILAISIILITTGYLFITYKHGYWPRKNVPTPKHTIPFGNLLGFGKKTHLSLLLTKYYNQMKRKGPFCGIYFFHSPAVLAIELNFIKNIMIKDFSSFQDRGLFYNEKDDPLSAHLVNVDGTAWKGMRFKLTPTFTSGKMKFMFPTIIGVADEFQKVLSSMIQDDEEIEMKELFARFTTDIIGTCAFGIDCNSLKDPKAQFRAMGKKVFENPRHSGFMEYFVVTFKNTARRLHMKEHHDDVTKFFLNSVRETVELRERENIRRNDFMDLLIEIKNKETLNEKKAKLTIEEVAAQAFVFFLAGFETSSTTLSYVLYELAKNTDIQSKAREEVKSVLLKHEGKFTYEAMMDMHYIDYIINESLRKYPPIAYISREATNHYKVPDTSLVIDKGTHIMIPVYAIHHDSDIYENPETFNPERFEPTAVHSRPSGSFLAFGDGPRNCIGLRFGMMQARIGLITLLRNFEFELSDNTKVPLDFMAKGLILTIKGGLFVKFRKLKMKL